MTAMNFFTRLLAVLAVNERLDGYLSDEMAYSLISVCSERLLEAVNVLLVRQLKPPSP